MKNPSYDVRLFRCDIFNRFRKEMVRTGKLPREKTSPEEARREAYRLLGQGYLDNKQSTDLLNLMEEQEWETSGRHVYFPVPGLLDKLLSARMEVTAESLVFPPHPFVLAIPSGTSIRSALVCRHTNEDRESMSRQFCEYTGLSVGLAPTDRPKWSMFMTQMFRTCGTGVDARMEGYRFGCRDDQVQAILEAETPEQVSAVVGSLREHDPSCLTLESHETESQMLLMRAVTRLLVYMTTFPDAVRDGFPSREAEHLSGMYRKAKTLGEKHFPRNAPSAHYRRWHFRSYPLRKDGSRKPGVLFVNESMVRGRGHVITEV